MTRKSIACGPKLSVSQLSLRHETITKTQTIETTVPYIGKQL